MEINKDTLIFGSYSINPGNNGCIYFNKLFKDKKINAIYKSFKIHNIENGIKAIKTLDIKGVGISAPYKMQVVKYLDEIDDLVKNTQVCNTVINMNNKLYGYNTDYLGLYEYLKNLNYKHITIIGNGGFSKTLQYVCKKLNIQYDIITRSNWHKLDAIIYDVIFNCTPIDDLSIRINKTNRYIDGVPTSETGKILANLQAKYQFELYEKFLIQNL